MEEITCLMEMWTPSDLESYASGYQDENYVDEKPATEYDWQLFPEFPLSEFLKPSQATGIENVDGWIEFFRKENEMSASDYGHAYWNDLDTEDIQDPIVVSYDEAGKWHIWDGWHRTAGSFAGGKTSIPAVVGTPKRNKM